MFDIEQLSVYKKIRSLNKKLLPGLLSVETQRPYLVDQLKRASLSVSLNLAEGIGRESPADRKQFLIRARASMLECVSILHVFEDIGYWSDSKCSDLCSEYEEISKMLWSMIRNLNARMNSK